MPEEDSWASRAPRCESSLGISRFPDKGIQGTQVKPVCTIIPSDCLTTNVLAVQKPGSVTRSGHSHWLGSTALGALVRNKEMPRPNLPMVDACSSKDLQKAVAT